ncbi:hypothetical protein PPACK8108_LOCUS21957 [Phakopsora pachyrhizi]|uniref:Uncharacterized protein n=1 Tax=Phakopsora pachyrhizi TaxID=170000 RepID=A0AAV0BKK1_PHAPC|nr:hypothetical protein PPACK8108_LOCUS21957 [Phakopsora pachyrhizi]
MEKKRGTVETEQPKKKSIHKMAEGGSKVRTRMNFQINKLNVDGQHLKEKPNKRNKGWNLHRSKCKIESKRDLGYECDSRKWPTEKRLASTTISTSMEEWKLSTSLAFQEQQWCIEQHENLSHTFIKIREIRTECQRPGTEELTTIKRYKRKEERKREKENPNLAELWSRRGLTRQATIGIEEEED